MIKSFPVHTTNPFSMLLIDMEIFIVVSVFVGSAVIAALLRPPSG
jgi:hypothetical protein